MYRPRNSIPVLALLLLTCGTAVGQQDRSLPINLEADRVTFDDRQGISTYHGNVIFTQGVTRLTGDTITVYRKDGEADRAVAVGNPAYFFDIDEQGREVEGEANTIDYQVGSGVALFLGNAKMRQDKDRFSGEKITYDSRRERVDASSEGGSGRIKAILHPRRDDAEAKP